MLRWLTVSLALGVVAAGVVALAINLISTPDTTTTTGNDNQPAAVTPGKQTPPNPAYAQGQPSGISATMPAAQMQVSDLVVVPGHVAVILKQDVPSQHDGKLLYLATEIKSEEEAKKLQAAHPDLVIKVDEFFLYTEIKPGE